MKEIKSIVPKKKYVLSFYELKRYFDATEISIMYNDELKYQDYLKVHAGAYNKLFSKELTEAQLKKQMALYGFQKNQMYYFYGSVNESLIHKGILDVILTIKEISSYDNGLSYILNPKKKKKRNPASHNKNGKRYYCDCMRCTGHTYEMNQKIYYKDEQKINKDE